MKEFLAEHGIQQRLSAAFRPQQNGKAERFNHGMTQAATIVATVSGPIGKAPQQFQEQDHKVQSTGKYHKSGQTRAK
eukprot:360701-Chlamydomonas_euryale.AAC.3